MRSFLTRLANFVTRTVLLVPCLLVCLACATPTPFPFEKLEEDMTAESVRAEIGEPESIIEEWHWGSEPTGRLVIRWHYTHEEGIWGGGETPVVLYFEEDKLVRWVEIESESESGGYDATKALKEYQDQQQHWRRMKDIGDHKKRRKHRHDH